MKFPANLYAIKNKRKQFLSNDDYEVGPWAKEACQIRLYDKFEEANEYCEFLNGCGPKTFAHRFSPYYIVSLTLEYNSSD